MNNKDHLSEIITQTPNIVPNKDPLISHNSYANHREKTTSVKPNYRANCQTGEQMRKLVTVIPESL